MSKRDTIYVALLDEGVDVWRPVAAQKVSPDTYLIVDRDYDPRTERWESSPGPSCGAAGRAATAARFWSRPKKPASLRPAKRTTQLRGRCSDDDFFALTAFYADLDDDVIATARISSPSRLPADRRRGHGASPSRARADALAAGDPGA